MKNKFLEYKGYFGSYELSEEDDVFFGKLEFIKDLVSYEGQTPKGLKNAFIDAVDDYLDTCSIQGKKPDTPFKGSLNIRIGEELHKKVALSLSKGESINSFVKRAIEKEVS